jgi:Pentapeptide repeats (8 copies)
MAWIKRSRIRIALVSVCGMLLIVALIPTVITWAPHWLASTGGLNADQRAAEVGRVRTALLAVLAGSLAAIGAIYTARTFALNRQGQITQRFTGAVDQLGDDKLDVRLGGIYALERLARESRDEHAPIVEILTAYVREHAPRPPRDDAISVRSRSGESAGAVPAIYREPVAEAKPATDVQAVLTVLGRREVVYEADSVVLDLRGTTLRGAKLGGAHLERAILKGAHLEGADLGKARLRGADLTEAHLEDANLAEAHLEDATLTDAHLEGAILVGAHLAHAFLYRAHLEGANLVGAHLNANFSSAHLEGASLWWAHLEGAGLGGAHLEGANLTGAHLEDANLSEAHLEGAVFIEAYDSSTTEWPTGFIPRDHGVIRPG